MLAAVLFGLFLVVLLLGVPIGFSMGFLTIAAFEVGNGPLITLAQKMYAGINNFTYLAIPLFIFAAEIMSRCGLTMSIVKLCDALVGHIRGGLAHVNILGSMLFAGISGSATADASGLGKIEIEMMEKAGYRKEYAAAITAASICEMALCYYFAVKHKHPRREKRTPVRDVLVVFWDSLPALGMPLIIMGGITTGIFTATESSAIAVFYALIVAFCKKQITWKSLVECCLNTAKTTANTMFIIAVATAMSYAITILRIPQEIVSVVMENVHSPYVFLLITNIILIILGCVLDQSPALLMMVPILLPIATQFGIDPVHFGVLCCFNLTIGLISPPVGMTLFVTANVAKVKLTALFKEVIPFVVLGYATLFLITYVPQIVTFIPNLLK